MTDPYRYKPLLWSEKLLSVLPGQPPYLGCGVSSATHGVDLATAGEFSLLGNGRKKGKAARTNDLKRGWRAFLKVADSNGIPDTDDYIRIHRAIAKGYPDPQKLWTRDWQDIVSALDSGYAISIAVRLSAVPNTAASRYTTADHQTVIFEPNLAWGDKSKRLCRNGKTKSLDPMHNHSNTYSGHVVDLADIRKAAKAIEGGLILAWLYPIGGWTQEALKTESLRRQVKNQKGRIETLRDKHATAIRQRDEARDNEAEAKAEATRLQDIIDSQPGTGNAKAAGWESALNNGIEALQQLRTEGPPA